MTLSQGEERRGEERRDRGEKRIVVAGETTMINKKLLELPSQRSGV